MGKYFGTDGVRGVAGADLTCELAMKIGRGAAAVLTGSTGHAAHTIGPKILSHNKIPTFYMKKRYRNIFQFLSVLALSVAAARCHLSLCES